MRLGLNVAAPLSRQRQPRLLRLWTLRVTRRKCTESRGDIAASRIERGQADLLIENRFRNKRRKDPGKRDPLSENPTVRAADPASVSSGGLVARFAMT